MEQIVEIVGVNCGDGTRSCATHEVCGHFLDLGMLLFLVKEVQENDHPRESTVEIPQEQPHSHHLQVVVKAYRIAPDGKPMCHVGFLPRRLLRGDHYKLYVDRFVVVKEDLRLSENSHARKRSHWNCGIVRCKLLPKEGIFACNPFKDAFEWPTCCRDGYYIENEEERRGEAGEAEKKKKRS